ncbi:hypothetical protein [Halococcus sp. IIIV-5B]|uniref:hypothetical protein n=1 Tax=Halococcus sp. IIIV-5B TaxID=2321230 RepID=UPI001F41A57E|nr:hypothetical protein [Halococcus sp. IIIV-5B]
MSQATESNESESNRSPGQIIPRYVDTRIKVEGWPVKKFMTVFAPAGVFAFIALSAFLASMPTLGWLSIALGGVAMIFGGYIAVTSDWHTPPMERFQNWRAFRSLSDSMPWNHSETVAQSIAGIDKILDNGIAVKTDGTLVALVHVRGRPTDRLTEQKTNQLVNQLGNIIDEQIKDFDFAFYSTTLPTSVSELANHYHDRAESDSFEGPEYVYVRELLHRVGDWLKNEDDPTWDAPEWRHYIAVEISPGEVTTPGTGPGFSWIDILDPRQDTGNVSDRQQTRAAKRELRKRIKAVEDGMNRVDGLQAEQISPDEHAYLLLKYWTGEHHEPDAELERAFREPQTGPTVWPPARSAPEDPPLNRGEVDTLARKDNGADESENGDGTDETAENQESGVGSEDMGNATAAARLFSEVKRLTPGLSATTSEDEAAAEAEGFVPPDEQAQGPGPKMLAPGVFDVSRDHIRVGDQVCRTYWIVEWPTKPESLFWQKFYTTFGAELEAERNPDAVHDVNLDVCVPVRSASRGSVMETLKTQWGSIGAESLERSEDGGDVSALGVGMDQDIYTQMFELLRTTNAQPWRVSAYVTVRAGEEQAIDTFEDMLTEHASIEGAALDALRHRSEQIRKRLEGAPINCMPRAAQERHLEAFQACAPNVRDPFVEAGDRNLKTRPMPGHAVASIFPFCGETIHEERGIDFGRNLENGSFMKIDPFDRGISPHIITIGVSRSGKTTFASQAVGRWYGDQEDRTLIALDTQGGFDGLTKALNGKHVVVGGGDGVNPFHIESPDENEQHIGGTGASPFEMKSDAVTNFIVAIIRSQGVDPSPYTNTIEQLVRRTYIQAGIEPGNPETHANESPTMRDFIDTALELKEEPGPLTHGSDEDVTMNKEKAIAGLLDLLGGFKEGQKYEYLLDEDDSGLMDESDMAYIDLRQFRDSSAAEKSAMFRLMLDQVNQKIKQTDGEVIFLIDEAHFLLHSPDMVGWLEKAAREWARYDACLWFASQSPREFVQQAEGGENKRRTIRDQCSVVQFFRTPGAENQGSDSSLDATLEEFGMNPKQRNFIKNEAVPGKEGEGYTECLVSLDDRDGWFPEMIQLSDYELDLLDYRPRKHGDFARYMHDQTGVPIPEESEPAEPTPEDGPNAQDDAAAAQPVAMTDGSSGATATADASNGEQEASSDEETQASDEPIPIQEVKGIGPTFADRLSEHGIESAQDLANSDPEEVAEQADAQEWRARKCVEQAQAFLPGQTVTVNTDGSGEPTEAE